MVSKADKDKINKLIKKLKRKRVPKKKKSGQKQKQRQSVVQNVRISAPQQSQRAIGFPTQVIQTPSSDTEFLRSIIQQQNQNNLTRNYQANAPQQVVRLNDQIGLRDQVAFPQPPPPSIEPTIPEPQGMSNPNFREAMLQQQDIMVAKANANAPKSKRVKVSKDVAFATAFPIVDASPAAAAAPDVKVAKKGRTEEQKYKNMSLDELATAYITGSQIQKNKALKEGKRRGYTQTEIDKFSGLGKAKPVPSGLTTPTTPTNPNVAKFREMKKATPPINKNKEFIAPKKIKRLVIEENK